jgi:tetratricopeptide (TPR) repeat protein
MNEFNEEKIQDERDILNNRACQFAKEGKYADSIKLFDDLLATYPKDRRARENKITVLGISGRYDEALALYEKCLAEVSLSITCRISHVNLLTYMGHYKRALQCRKLIGHPPPMTYMLLGSLSEDYKKLESFKSKSRTMDEAVKKMEMYRSQVTGGSPSDKIPRFISLEWAACGKRWQ